MSEMPGALRRRGAGYVVAALAAVMLLVAACGTRDNDDYAGTIQEVAIGGDWIMRQGDDGFVVGITDMQRPDDQGFVLSRSSLSRGFQVNMWENGERTGYGVVYTDGRLTSLQQYVAGAEHGLAIRFDYNGAPEAMLMLYEHGNLVAEKKLSDIDWQRH